MHENSRINKPEKSKMKIEVVVPYGKKKIDGNLININLLSIGACKQSFGSW